ncbi:MAG TPA: diguanylate cyclase, partial [Longimicrobiales bacterium]|nr:diguanylate cyclase [Longimicrobiales bacterium]
DQVFAVCYADLDHFKEFNDRYGYNHGDRVIRLLSLILRDVVKGRSEDGFVGHIGGDDFIFNVPLDRMQVCCDEIIEIFDELIPYQYHEEDRRVGYFLGRDRRGNILWVPLMTLSIGVVTNQHRRFTHTAKVSELATEMKTFAKKQPGSIYAVDRRSDQRDGFFGRSITTSDELEPPTEP